MRRGLIALVALVPVLTVVQLAGGGLFDPYPTLVDKNDQPPLMTNRPDMIILCEAYWAAPNWKLTYVLSGPNQDAIAVACGR